MHHNGNGVCPVNRGAVPALCWLDGVFSMDEPASGRRPNVEIQLGASTVGGKLGLASMVVTLEPMRQRFLELGGEAPEVQMFRYVGADGVPRRLLWCADCGHQMVYDFSELRSMNSLKCRKCSAVVTDQACPAWHAFGRCGHCHIGSDVPP